MTKGELVGHSDDYLAEPLPQTALAADLKRALSLPRSNKGVDYDVRTAPLAGSTEINTKTEVIFSGPVKGY